MIDFDKIVGFDWDDSNRHKLAKHKVGTTEAEQVFADEMALLFRDARHGEREDRFHFLARTRAGRLLLVVFTLRKSGQLIRVISARDMNMKEKAVYD